MNGFSKDGGLSASNNALLHKTNGENGIATHQKSSGS